MLALSSRTVTGLHSPSSPIGSEIRRARAPILRPRPLVTVRRGLAAAFTLATVLLFGIGYSALVARHVATDPASIAEAAADVVAQPEVRTELERTLAVAIQQGLDDGTAGSDDDVALDWARAAVGTPEFTEGVRVGLIALHGNAFGNRSGAVLVDPMLATTAVRSVAADVDPLVADQLPADAEIQVPIPVTHVPRLGELADEVDRLLVSAVLAGAACLVAALGLHDRPQRVLGLLGLAMMAVAAVHLLGAVELPAVADAVLTEVDDVPIARPLARAAADDITTRAVVLAGLATALAVAGLAWDLMASRRQQRSRRDAAYDWTGTDPVGDELEFAAMTTAASAASTVSSTQGAPPRHLRRPTTRPDGS